LDHGIQFDIQLDVFPIDPLEGVLKPVERTFVGPGGQAPLLGDRRLAEQPDQPSLNGLVFDRRFKGEGSFAVVAPDLVDIRCS